MPPVRGAWPSSPLLNWSTQLLVTAFCCVEFGCACRWLYAGEQWFWNTLRRHYSLIEQPSGGLEWSIFCYALDGCFVDTPSDKDVMEHVARSLHLSSMRIAKSATCSLYLLSRCNVTASNLSSAMMRPATFEPPKRRNTHRIFACALQFLSGDALSLAVSWARATISRSLQMN